MQKELNVIKFFLTVAVLFVISNLYCQKKISGRYSNLMLNQEYYNYFEFYENGVFEYHSGADLGDDEFGKGHYKIENDTLILNYNLTELKEESYFRIKKYYNSKDSIQINLNIYDFKNNPLDNIMVYSFPIYKSTESNKNGISTLKFKKGLPKEKIEIHIDAEFWSKQIIYLDLITNYNIDVYMSSLVKGGFSHPKALKNQIIKYKILEYKDEFMKLKNKEGSTISFVKQIE